MSPIFFESSKAWRKWLSEHHDTETELYVGLWKKGAKEGSMTRQEAVDEALCHGWIDGVTKSLGDETWQIRFTPRRKGSYWSEVNRKRMKELLADGRVAKPGLAAWEKRDEGGVKAYSFENAERELSKETIAALKKNAKAWRFLEEQSPSYRRVVAFWLTQAKQEKTKEARIAKATSHHAKGERLPQFVSPAKRPKA